MKNSLKTVFNHLSMGFRLLHATHIKKDRQTYLAYLQSAYGLRRADINDYSRADLRKIFRRCNSRAAISAQHIGIAGAWAGVGVAAALNLVAVTAPWMPVFYCAAAAFWGGLAVMETKNIHKKAESDLSFRKSMDEHQAYMDEMDKIIKERAGHEQQAPEDTNAKNTGKGEAASFARPAWHDIAKPA